MKSAILKNYYADTWEEFYKQKLSAEREQSFMRAAKHLNTSYVAILRRPGGLHDSTLISFNMQVGATKGESQTIVNLDLLDANTQAPLRLSYYSIKQFEFRILKGKTIESVPVPSNKKPVGQVLFNWFSERGCWLEHLMVMNDYRYLYIVARRAEALTKA